MGNGNPSKLLVVFGDQLTTDTPAFQQCDKDRDIVWMAELHQESKYVWSSKQRTTLFLSAMRHFAEDLRQQGYSVHYRNINDRPSEASLEEALAETLNTCRINQVVATLPGEYRILEELRRACSNLSTPLEVLEDTTFYSTPEEFTEFAAGRKQLRLEYFYRQLRRKHSILMEGDQPTGGKWNYDASNRSSFGKTAPRSDSNRQTLAPDSITREVMGDVEKRFPEHPGSLEVFSWPVTRQEALKALAAFIEDSLPHFGQYQDAMWTNRPFLNHSLLASSLNLKLLHPREVVEAAEAAYRIGRAPIESVEGFIRQILGWREYVRGLYWLKMPEYLEMNELDAQEPLPDFYWTGETPMRCIQEVVTQTMNRGYAHHIQRLMVTGLYALLLGVRPKAVHQWYLAVYVDAVEWVELPNTLGMSQFADGGIMASKPYAASGKYINRMSNYCKSCRFKPDKRTGPDACPFTTLYWDFLDRNRKRIEGNPRMTMQLKNLKRISESELSRIKTDAAAIKARGPQCPSSKTAELPLC
ncbi:MAG: cryptochrome/photolyase family protein [Verrucomicrobiota bacterium]